MIGALPAVRIAARSLRARHVGGHRGSIFQASLATETFLKGGLMNFDTIRQDNTTTSLVTSLAIVLTTLAAVIAPLFIA